jgi:hypothetical protein
MENFFRKNYIINRWFADAGWMIMSNDNCGRMFIDREMKQSVYIDLNSMHGPFI